MGQNPPNRVNSVAGHAALATARRMRDRRRGRKRVKGVGTRLLNGVVDRMVAQLQLHLGDTPLTGDTSPFHGNPLFIKDLTLHQPSHVEHPSRYDIGHGPTETASTATTSWTTVAGGSRTTDFPMPEQRRLGRNCGKPWKNPIPGQQRTLTGSWMTWRMRLVLTCSGT